MAVKASLALCILRLGFHRQQATETARQEELAWQIHSAASLFRNPERREITA
jgi:hypothetical protein